MPLTTGTGPGDFAATDGSISKFEHPDQVLVGGSNSFQFSGISIPANVTITGMDVLLVTAILGVTSTAPSDVIDVSVNDGSSFGSNVVPSPNAFQSFLSGVSPLLYGSSTELWGIPISGGWDTLDSSASDLVIRINTVASNGNVIYIDQLQVRIYYETVSNTGGLIQLTNGLVQISEGFVRL